MVQFTWKLEGAQLKASVFEIYTDNSFFLNFCHDYDVIMRTGVKTMKYNKKLNSGTSTCPIFLKIDTQTQCKTGKRFLTSKVDIDAKLINYSWLMTHCQPGHYDTSLCPIFLKIDRQTHCKTGNRFLTSKVDIDAKLMNYSWLMTHCQPEKLFFHFTYNIKHSFVSLLLFYSCMYYLFFSTLNQGKY